MSRGSKFCLFMLYFVLFFGSFWISVMFFQAENPEISVISATVSSFNSSATSESMVSARFDIAFIFSVHNPNKRWDINYDQVRVASLLVPHYGSDDVGFLSERFLRPFRQGEKSTTVVKTRVLASGEIAGRESEEPVGFDLMFGSLIKFKPWGSMFNRYVVAHCRDVVVMPGWDTFGSLVGLPIKCRVYFSDRKRASFSLI